MPVRLGVLGCGSIARTAHLLSLARINDAKILALADANASNLAAARPIAPDARPVSDYVDVLDMPDVDAVIIALPPALHSVVALEALHRQKHVYVEKPLATNVTDGERVVAAWQASGLTAMMGFNYRFNPIVRQARARIAAGAIGTPIGVRTVFATPRRAIPPWKQRRETGGGVLLDLAVHHIDLIRFLVDAEISHVGAEVRSIASEHDTAFLQSSLTNGAVAQSMCSLSVVEEDRIELYGASAKLTIDRYRSLRVEETPPNTGGALSIAVARLAAEVRALPYALEKLSAPLKDPSFPLAMGAFVRGVRDRAPVTPSLSDGLRALAVIEAAELSARSGRVIALDEQPAAATSDPRTDVAGA